MLNIFRRKKATGGRRSFDAATGGRRAGGMGSFGRINPEVSAANFSLRSRARYLAQNNPWLSKRCWELDRRARGGRVEADRPPQ